jgi:ornithine cyclodeaminase/alanine dehydrogenase-like protein (mu-crystallin family)
MVLPWRDDRVQPQPATHDPLTQTFRILSEPEVQALYDPAVGWRSIEAAYRDLGSMPEIQSRPPVMTIAGTPAASGALQLGQFRVKGAAVPSYGVAGAFLFSREHPKMFLWNAETRAPIALLACDWLSKRRVALTVAVAIEALARPDVRKIALFGAGAWAQQTCELVAEHWSGAEIAVVASRLHSATAFAERMPDNVGPAADADSALQGADVAITLTTATEPFIHAGRLELGALLLSMGSPHEVDVAVLRECDALIVDDIDYVHIQGDIHAWLARGEIDEAELADRLRGNIGQVLAGLAPGRTGDDERLLAVIQGLTACDVALAKAVLDRALAQGVGQTVEL